MMDHVHPDSGRDLSRDLISKDIKAHRLAFEIQAFLKILVSREAALIISSPFSRT